MNTSKLNGRWWATLGLMLAGVWLAGCHTAKPQFGEVPGTTGAGKAVAANRVTEVKTFEDIKVVDALTIVFSDINPQPQPFVDTVRADGTIKLLMDHAFTAVGKKRGDLEKEIHDFYVPSYYKYMTVTISFKDQFYSVGGEVRAPSRFPYLGLTTVTRAIQSAGDFTDFARRRTVKLFRVDGKIENVDCLEALKKPSLDLQVYPGDLIKVERRKWPWQE